MYKVYLFILFCITLSFFYCKETNEGPLKEESQTYKKTPKGDCPDCDPAGPNAFIQSGIAYTFYKVGEKWQMLFEFNQDFRMLKNNKNFILNDTGVKQDIVNDNMFLFEYEVIGLRKEISNNIQREIAKISVVEANPDPFTSERLDQFEKKMEFELNDLLEPVSQTIFNREYPNGKNIPIDKKSELTQTSFWPTVIPRVLAHSGTLIGFPELPNHFTEILDEYWPNWRKLSFKKFILPDTGDIVIFAIGYKWPFYIKTRLGQGILISYK